MVYIVEVIIMNKKSARDPEGETIHRELILKRGFNEVKGIRSGKYLEFLIDSNSPEEALEAVKSMCSKLRIYNPVIHDIKVRLNA